MRLRDRETPMPFRPFDRSMVAPMPADLDGWVASDHPVRFIDAFVEALSADDWQAMGIGLLPAARGAPAYHPHLLVRAWLAGFMLGIRSSRALETACRDSIPLRWLTANQQPDHNTLWRFYQRYRAGMRVLLRRTVTVAVTAGLVELAVVAIDGSKISGAAARDRTLDEAGLLALLARTEQAIADLEAQNQTDDDAPPSLPPTLRDPQALRRRVVAALDQLRAPNGPTRINLTDPEAVLLPSRHGWVAGYNGQLAVTPVVADATGVTGQLITAAELTQDTHDRDQLLPVLAASLALTGQAPDVAVADGGYYAGATLAACRERGQVVVMPEPTPAAERAPYHQRHFTYVTDRDQFICPSGQPLPFAGEKTRSDRPAARVYRAGGATCRTCPAFGVCTTDARQGRSLEVSPFVSDLTRHRDWMATAAAKAWLAQRKTLPEPVFGVLKEQQGLRRFLLRGLANVTAEWRLLATAFNLRVLARYWRQGRLDGALTT
jgi:transposase